MLQIIDWSLMSFQYCSRYNLDTDQFLWTALAKSMCFTNQELKVVRGIAQVFNIESF